MDDLVQAIRARAEAVAPRPVLVALDGHSAAGKSTLARHLAGRLAAAIVPMDDFYRDEAEDVRLTYDAAQGVRRYFHWERVLEAAVLPLRTGVGARYRPFDWQAGHGLADPVTIPSAPVVILEGIYSARPELRAFLDLTVLVEAPSATRLRRQRDRHDPHDWERRWDRAERLYFDTISLAYTYDLVIAGG